MNIYFIIQNRKLLLVKRELDITRVILDIAIDIDDIDQVQIDMYMDMHIDVGDVQIRYRHEIMYISIYAIIYRYTYKEYR